ncbi:MAG: EAL domain-containing response regulator [Campylobacterota bacterium]
MNKEKIDQLMEVGKDLSVLYIEDNKEARESTLDLLQDFFPRIEVAADGEEGLQKFYDNRYDFIITDINMPRLNGIDMIEKIRQSDLDVPILITSAYNDSGYFMETIRLGVEGYLLKPVELNQFVDMLTKAVEKISLKKENEAYRKQLEKENRTLARNVHNKEKMLQDQMFLDQLTGLQNRASLDAKMSEADSNPQLRSILFLIDINNFKNINSLYSIDTGNEVLRTFGKQLREFASANGYEAFRTSADEFALFAACSECSYRKIYEDITSMLEQVDGKEVEVDGENIMITITVGIAFECSDLFNKASLSLEEAKRKNKKFIEYENALDTTDELKNMFYWQKELTGALQESRIVPFFQPIFDGCGNVVKYEALMRLYKADSDEYVSPFFFLDVSLQTKQYDQVSQMMIEKVLKVARANKDTTFTINLNYKDMQNEKISGIFHEYMEESIRNNIRCNLVFEIVESQDIDNYKKLKEFFDSFDCRELKIAVDDFGSGYSNFTQILSLLPEYIKIDGSLIKNIDHDIQSLVLVKAIISFARKLSIKTIAEFVHSKEVYDILKDEGIDQFQGFYLGKPQPKLL